MNESGNMNGNVVATLRLRGELDPRVLRMALAHVVARHEVLRTAFRAVDGVVVPFAGPQGECAVLCEQTVDDHRAIEQIVERESAQQFDLLEGPLIRARVIRAPGNEVVLMVTVHRSISDRRALKALVCELASSYVAMSVHGNVSFADDMRNANCSMFPTDLLSAERLKHQSEQWTRNIAEPPEALRLSTARLSRSHAALYQRDRLQWVLPADVVQGLKEMARQQAATLFDALLSGWAALLARWTRQDEVVVGARMIASPRERTIALRILVGGQTAAQLLANVHSSICDSSAYRDLAFDHLAQLLERGHEGRLLPQALVTMEDPTLNDVSAVPQMPALQLSALSVEEVLPGLELLLSIHQTVDGVSGALEYANELFDRQAAQTLLGCWQALLRGMAQWTQSLLGELPMLTAAAREQVLYGFNDTAAAYPGDRLIHELFEAQVLRAPDAVALKFQDRQMTFRELNETANQLGWFLHRRGVGPDRTVALCVERGMEMVVGMLGVLKAGGAYVPLDPSYPAERLKYMLEDAAPQILLTQQGLARQLVTVNRDVIFLDSDWPAIAAQQSVDVDAGSHRVRPSNLAYVIYTSGSTGLPKAALNEHRGMVNRIVAQRHIEQYVESDVCCQKTSISFVDAVLEVFAPLCNGLPLVIIPQAVVSDLARMANLIAAERISRLTTVPSLARSMLDSPRIMRDLSGLRSWTLSGEEVLPDLLTKLQRELPGCEFVIQYGSSEVSSDAAIYQTKNFSGDRVPIGRPLPNVQMYVLDQHGEPVPIGMTGEICVGGVGVGRGYLNKPELTATRFVRDPWRTDGESRLYKTGDLGRWRPDGILEYLGRQDNQVKVRGFRIEPGEIEARLLHHERVAEAAVLARKDFSGDHRLIAYVTLRDDRSGGLPQPVTAQELRAHLKGRLPDYMVPSAFVILDRMPRTPNGKLDRRALPPPTVSSHATHDYEPPRGEKEEILADIWKSVLGVERVGRQDNFFELGGHSLVIVQLMERLHDAGLSTKVRHVFDSPSLQALAAVLSSELDEEDGPSRSLIPDDCTEITPQMLPLIDLTATQIDTISQSVPGGARNIQDIYPLSPLQAGMLFHHLLIGSGGGDTYVRPLLFVLESSQAVALLVRSLQGVIDRHDILRTAILWEQLPQPVQVVSRRATLPVEQISLDVNREAVRQLEDLMSPERQRLDLRKAPLLRLQVSADPHRSRWYALLQTHHLVFDDESFETMLAEVSAFAVGRERDLPEARPYRDHVARVSRRNRSDDAEQFFRDKLAGLEGPTVAFGLGNVHGSGSHALSTRAAVEPALAARVRACARSLGVSPATVFHAAVGLVVAATSGRQDVVYGSVMLGRLHGGISSKSSLGMFVNTLPLRLQLDALTAEGLIRQTNTELARLADYEHASLAEIQRSGGASASAPLFNTLLNYLHAAAEMSSDRRSLAPGIEILASREWSNYPIVLTVEDRRAGFVLTAQTDPQIEPQRLLDYVTVSLGSLVAAIEQAPSRPALALPILPERERRQVIEYFNATSTPTPSKPVHRLIEDQARHAPQGVAIVCGNRTLTYADLNARAGVLAKYLLTEGICAEQLVGVYMERSPEMVVALLAIMKAGGAYVPLDPSQPAERLSYMLRDAAPKVLLTQGKLRGALPATTASVVAVDDDWAEIVGRPASTAGGTDRELHLDASLYVIYTSGSTGVPKGAVVTHRNLLNHIQWHCAAFDVSRSSRCSGLSAVGFDAAAWEIWPTLCAGATLVMASPKMNGDPEALMSWWASESLDVSFITTPMAELAFSRNIGNPRLRTLLVGGDTLRFRPMSKAYALVNNYGPTETTIAVTSGCVDEDTVLHIGKPISNARIYILDARLQPVPVGVAGEIYIGGVVVGRGYVHQPALTAQRFLPDPFSGKADERMYRSGDLGRWRANGTIEHLGRRDQQVKIRGYRIELGEIEASLGSHELIKDVAVAALQLDSGEKRLIAYIVLRVSAVSASSIAEALRSHLRASLPEYMVPSDFVLLDSLPLTVNGKLDRKSLPAPQLMTLAPSEAEAPQGELEETLAKIWQPLLHLQWMGRDDNFFERGGHSLLATQAVVRMREALAIEIPLSVLFKYPTIRQLSAHFRENNLLDDFTRTGDVDELMQRVAAMQEDDVQQLMQRLRARSQ